MSQEFKYKAIVLGKRDVGEADRLYVLYTQEKGKITILGKGVRKPNARLAGNLETLNFSEVFVSQGRGRGNITGVINLESFSALRASQQAMERVFEVFYLLEKLIEPEEQDEQIFALILEYLNMLNQNEDKGEIFLDLITQGFIYKLLDFLGYRLEAKKCVICGVDLKLEKNFLSPNRGGIICQNCSGKEVDKIPLGNNVIKVFRLFSDNQMRNFSKIKISQEDLRSLRGSIERFVRWIN